MGKIIQGHPIIPGRAEGLGLVANEPLSFWGGYDYHTGEITDRRHPLSGQIATGKILAVPFTRGSSTTTAVLLVVALVLLPKFLRAGIYSGKCDVPESDPDYRCPERRLCRSSNGGYDKYR